MNRFSHGVDKEIRSFDLRESIDNLTVLTHRLLERREATLTYTAPESEIRLTCDSFLVQRALFCSWELAMDAAGSSPVLDLVVQPGDNGVDLLVSGRSGRSGRSGARASRLVRDGGSCPELPADWGARSSVDFGETGFTIRINLPVGPETGF